MNTDALPRVLIVDDRDDILGFCARHLGRQYAFHQVHDGPAALAELRTDACAAVLLDRDFSQADPQRLLGPRDDVRNEGLRILEALRLQHPGLPVIMVTGLRDLGAALRATGLGAGFLAWEDICNDPTLLEARLHAACDGARRGWEADVAPFRRHGIVIESESMGRALQQLSRAIPSRAPILLLGPSGSGKDCLADAVHAVSANADGPFIQVNAATLDAEQLNNELFGHTKGSYTDAKTDWKGLFAAADGGTFFLNEVADLPLESQAKLLTVLESEMVRPLGSEKFLPARFRLVAATSRDLCRLVAEGRFREDLWHRLAWHTVTLPPLRERREDIPALATMFLRGNASWRARGGRGFTREAIEYLEGQPWPGNVRSLQSTVEVAAAVAVHTITVTDVHEAAERLSALERARAAFAAGRAAPDSDRPADAAPSAALTRAEAELVVFAETRFHDLVAAYYRYLKKLTGGNMAAAARRAGIAKSTMCKWRDKIDGPPSG